MNPIGNLSVGFLLSGQLYLGKSFILLNVKSRISPTSIEFISSVKFLGFSVKGIEAKLKYLKEISRPVLGEAAKTLLSGFATIMLSLTVNILFLCCPSSNTLTLTCLAFLRRLTSRIFTSNIERAAFPGRRAFKITSSFTSRFLSRVSPVLLLVFVLPGSVAFFVFFSIGVLGFSGEGGFGLAFPSLSNIFTT